MSSLHRKLLIIPRTRVISNRTKKATDKCSQTVKNLPAMQKTQVRSLGQDDPLEKGMVTHSSILAWRIPMDRGAWRAAVHGVIKSWTRLSD